MPPTSVCHKASAFIFMTYGCHWNGTELQCLLRVFEMRRFQSLIGVRSELFSSLVIPRTGDSQLLVSCKETPADKAQKQSGTATPRLSWVTPAPLCFSTLTFGRWHFIFRASAIVSLPCYVQSFALLGFSSVHKPDQTEMYVAFTMEERDDMIAEEMPWHNFLRSITMATFIYPVFPLSVPGMTWAALTEAVQEAKRRPVMFD